MNMEQVYEALDNLIKAFTEFIRTVADTLTEMVNRIMEAFSAIYKTLTSRQRTKFIHGNSSNNWRKMHGKPMRRWRYLT